MCVCFLFLLCYAHRINLLHKCTSVREGGKAGGRVPGKLCFIICIVRYARGIKRCNAREGGGGDLIYQTGYTRILYLTHAFS